MIDFMTGGLAAATIAATGTAVWLYESRNTWRDIADAAIDKLGTQALQTAIDHAADQPGAASTKTGRTSRAIRAGVRELRRVAALGAEHSNQTLAQIIADPSGIRVDGQVNMDALTNAIIGAYTAKLVDGEWIDPPDTITVPIVTLADIAADMARSWEKPDTIGLGTPAQRSEIMRKNYDPLELVMSEAERAAIKRERDASGSTFAADPTRSERECFGLPVEVDPTLPRGQIEFRQGGKTVGSIVNIDPSDPASQERLRDFYTTDRHLKGDDT